MGVTPSISTSHSQQGLSSNSVLKFMFLKGILEHFKLILCISNGFSTRYPLKTSYICTKNLQQLDTPSTSLILACQPFLQFRIDFIAQKQFEMVIPKGKAIQLQRETRGSFFYWVQRLGEGTNRSGFGYLPSVYVVVRSRRLENTISGFSLPDTLCALGL